MEKFKVGSSYLPMDFLRHKSHWRNPLGYEIFQDKKGNLYVIDGDGDERSTDFLDPSTEIPFKLENE